MSSKGGCVSASSPPSGGHCRKLASALDFLRDFFNALSVPEVHGLIAKAPRGLIPMPLLLIWAGLLGQGELLARGPWCRETALPRSSSSAQRRRAGGSDPHGERRGERGLL